MAGNQQTKVKKLHTKDVKLTRVQREYIANLAKRKLTDSPSYSKLWPTQQQLALESILFKFNRAEFPFELKTVEIDKDTIKEIYVFKHVYRIPGLESEKDMQIDFSIEIEKNYLENKKW